MDIDASDSTDDDEDDDDEDNSDDEDGNYSDRMDVGQPSNALPWSGQSRLQHDHLLQQQPKRRSSTPAVLSTREPTSPLRSHQHNTRARRSSRNMDGAASAPAVAATTFEAASVPSAPSTTADKRQISPVEGETHSPENDSGFSSARSPDSPSPKLSAVQSVVASTSASSFMSHPIPQRNHLKLDIQRLSDEAEQLQMNLDDQAHLMMARIVELRRNSNVY